MTRIDTLIATIAALEGVEGTPKRWTRDGKDRLYINTSSLNGGKNWMGNVGYPGLYLDLATGQIVKGSVAGAKTRDYHARVETFEKIAAAYADYSAAS